MMARTVVIQGDTPWIALFRVTWLLAAVTTILMSPVPQSTLEAGFHLLFLCEVKHTMGGRGP